MPAQGYVPVIYNGRSRLLQTFIQRLASVKNFSPSKPVHFDRDQFIAHFAVSCAGSRVTLSIRSGRTVGSSQVRLGSLAFMLPAQSCRANQPPRGQAVSAGRWLLLLNATEIIDDREDACPHDNFRAFLRPGHSPIIGIDGVRQVDDGIEALAPNRHFTRAVSGNGF